LPSIFGEVTKNQEMHVLEEKGEGEDGGGEETMGDNRKTAPIEV
jgi:hypothetical protein